jgi:hypothetical protein
MSNDMIDALMLANRVLLVCVIALLIVVAIRRLS